jgi:hypothetical protein
MRWTTRAAGAAMAATILSGAGLGASRPAAAQVNPLGGELALQSAANTDPNAAPAVAADPAGAFVAVWQRQTGGSYQVFARLFDRNGTPLGAEFQVNVAATGCHRFPAVASDAAGNFVVAWQSEPGSGGSDIVVRKFNAAGTALSGEVTVDSTPAGTGNTNAAVAMAPNGEPLVVWQSNVAAGGGWGIYGQAFTADATPRLTGATQFEVSPAGTAGQVWQSNNGTASGIELRGFDGTGTATTAEIAASTAAASGQGRPRLAADASGNAVVVWQSLNQESGGWGYGVIARRFTSAGAPLGAEMLVNTTVAGDQFEPAVASDASGNFLVTWTSDAQDGSGLGVFGRGFDRRMVPSTGEMQLYSAASAPGDQHASALASSTAGRMFAVWQSDGAPAFVQGRGLQVEGLTLVPLPPCRLVDTRSPSDPLAAGESRTFDLTGLCGIVAAEAKALSLNVTAVTPSATGALTIVPADAPTISTATVFYDPGNTRPDNAVVALSRDGTVRVRVSTTAATNLVIDINGYFQ